MIGQKTKKHLLVAMVLVITLLSSCSADKVSHNDSKIEEDDIKNSITENVETNPRNEEIDDSSKQETVVDDEEPDDEFDMGSYVCYNFETDELCEDGQGPEIHVLHNNYFDELNEVFYIPHTFKTEMEYADYLNSTNSFYATDLQDGDIYLSSGFDLEENVFLLFAEDSNGNSTTWTIPTKVRTDTVNSSDNDDSSKPNSNIVSVDSSSQSKDVSTEAVEKLPDNVEPGSEKIVTADKAKELTNKFASEGNYVFDPVTLYVKYITPETFFSEPHTDSYSMTRVDSGTVLYNTRHEFEFDLNKIPMVQEDLNSNIPRTNVSYKNGILKYDRIMAQTDEETYIQSYTYDWNKGTMVAISRYSQKEGHSSIIYAEYDAHTRIEKHYQSYENTVGCDEMSVYNHATGQRWLFSGNSATSHGNSVVFKSNNIMDIYLSEHADELIK